MRRLENDELPIGLVGLDNKGNNCYMNAVLQCLMALERLTRAVLEHGALKKGGSRTPFTQALFSIFTAASKPADDNQKRLSHILPIKLQKLVHQKFQPIL